MVLISLEEAMPNPSRPPMPVIRDHPAVGGASRPDLAQMADRGGREREPVIFGEGPILPADVETRSVSHPGLVPDTELTRPIHPRAERDARIGYNRASNRPMQIIANNFVDSQGQRELVKLKPGKQDGDLVLMIDKQHSYAQIVITEPNVRELRDALSKWLGE